MRRLVWIQSRTLDNVEPEQILEPMLGKITDVRVNLRPPAPDYFKASGGWARFDAFIKASHAEGIKVWFWLCPGLWRVWGSLKDPLALEWSVRYLYPAERDWLNFSLPEVRQFVADVALNVLDNSHVDGISLDYIRYERQVVDRCATLSSADITETVRGIHGAMQQHYPGKSLMASVWNRAPDPWPNGIPHCYAGGQRWDDWLAAGIIEFVCPMHYCALKDMPGRVGDLVPDAQDRIVFLHSPTVPVGTTPLTVEEWTAIREFIHGRGFESEAFWDWSHFQGYHWDQLEAIGGMTVGDISEDFRAEIVNLETAATECEDQAAQLRAIIASVKAIVARLDVVDAQADVTAAEL